jgi:hypothetical protein
VFCVFVASVTSDANSGGQPSREINLTQTLASTSPFATFDARAIDATVCAPFTMETPLRRNSPYVREAAPFGSFLIEAQSAVTPLLKYQK